MMAWNGSREANRAIGDALPNLATRRKVLLFAFGASDASVVRHGFETPDCACSGGQG